MSLVIAKKEISNSWVFLIIVFLFYIVVGFFDFSLIYNSLVYLGGVVLRVFPILVVIFVLMFITNYFVTNQFIIKHFRSKGVKKWIYAVIGGTLSSGPIYMWYPLLAQLKQKGVNNGLIACFLYNRSIKLPLLPIMLLYFDWKYITILLIVMIVFSIIQGWILNSVVKN